jgi:chromosome segregation ATPase
MTGGGIDVRISNLGGITSAELRLEPGVNVLTGANGAGKTSAMRAVSRALGADVPVEVRDGADHGSVEAGGARLVVKKVARASGVAQVSLADGGPLADLIDPGLKDSDSAAKARIRALLRLVRVPVSEEILAQLAGDPEVFAAASDELLGQETTPDLLTAQERIRQHTHRLAREAESWANTCKGRLQAYEHRLAEIFAELGGEDHLAEIGAKEAEAAAQAAVRELEMTRLAAEKRLELERRQAELRASLVEAEDPAGYEAEIGRLAEREQAHRARIEKLEREIANERVRLAEASADLKHLRERQAEAAVRAEQQREARRILDLPVEGPTQVEVEALEEAVEESRDRLSWARLSDEARLLGADVESAREAARAATERAEQLRDAAGGIAGRLGQILAGTEASGLTVVDGRLAELVDGEAMDFERRRSDGQRIRAALRVAAKAYRGQVVPLDGRYWLALDDAARAEFGAIAAELGLYVLTERPTEGDLRVDHVRGEEAW